MKIISHAEKVKKFQEGGAMPPQPAPTGGAPMGGEQDPLAQILQIAGEALQTGNCEAAMAVCEALLMLAQQAQGGQAPVGQPQGEPTFKKGGKMCKKEKGGKNTDGGKKLTITVDKKK